MLAYQKFFLSSKLFKVYLNLKPEERPSNDAKIMVLNAISVTLNLVKTSYDYKDDYDYDYSTDDSGTDSSSNDASSGTNTTTASASGNATNSTNEKIQRINSASSELGLNILLTPDIANYFGDLKQGNSEGFRVK